MDRGDGVVRESSVDVVVVGAGLSGLTAAKRLLDRDPQLKVVVLEAKDRVGGRTCGQKLMTASGHDTWDMGGQWIGRCQPHIMSLVQELGLETYEQFCSGKKIIELSSGRMSYYESEIPSLSFLALIDLHRAIRTVDRMQRFVDPSDPGQCEYAAEWDVITAEEFIQRHLWTTGAKEAIESALRCIFGAEAKHMSLLYFLTYVACAGGLEPIISAKRNFGGQELKIKGGAWQICTKLAEKLGGIIQLTSPVVSIAQNNDSAVVKVSGKVITCKHVIMAIPPHLIGNINFAPSLPLDKRHVFQRMPVGYLTKVIVTYKTSFWRDAGLSGEVATAGGLPVIDSCDSGPLCIVFDATSGSGNPAIVSFIGGIQQINYSCLSSQDRRRAVLHSLAKFFGPDALSPVDYCEKNWNEEPYNGGCPVSVGTPGMMGHFKSALCEPFLRVHFAGTESATCWSGFLNGAVQSGYRAANEVLYNIRPQSVVAGDLEGTAYDKRQKRQVRVHQSSAKWLHVAFGIGFISMTMAYLWKYRLHHS